MDSEWGMFLGGAAVLIGYLFLSAMTEMGTKLPWRRGGDSDQGGDDQ
ncbi:MULTISPECIES: hypothetical protein [unclassified Leptolyngbya]|nr:MULTISPECIES: hypothetical protein [unclassified Leptolyngbya]MBD1911520.1 hypothetical protein [Leptolyngbya sp. FACHB-8]MBD2155239.1 hypothetical protein [Leptolyngbya sp. FACHB-16]